MNSNDIFIFKIKNEINFYDLKVNLKINNNYITRQLLLYDINWKSKTINKKRKEIISWKELVKKKS